MLSHNHILCSSQDLEAAAAGRFNSLEWHIIGAQAWAKQCDMAPRKRSVGTEKLFDTERFDILCSVWFCVFPFSAHFLCLH